MTTPQDPFRPPDDDGRDVPAGPAAGDPQAPPQGSAGTSQPQGSQPYGSAPYGSAPYGSAPYGSAPYGSAGPRRNGLGTAALIVGLLALVTSVTVVGGIVFGLTAIVLGTLGRGRAKRGEADNGSMAIAGLVLGVIGLLLSLAFIAAGVALFQSDDGQQLIECLEQAGNDAAAQEACQQQFADELGQ